MRNEVDLKKYPEIDENRTTTVLLVDDHEIVREGLRMMFDKESDLEIVGEAAFGEQAIEYFKKLQPDVVLLDIRLPDMDGFHVASKIREISNDVPIIMLTGYDSELYLKDAVKSQVNGFLTKESPRSVISYSVRLVNHGVSVWDSTVLNKVMKKSLSDSTIALSHPEDGPPAGLSDRELVVLDFLVKGASNKEIGNQLGFSDSTVKKYVYQLLRKLGVNNRTQAAIVAISRGLINQNKG
jgi:DNA-binding NarL/FixJ family response regulator